MLKQVIYNYVDLDGTIWNTVGNTIIEGQDPEGKPVPTNNQLNISNG